MTFWMMKRRIWNLGDPWNWFYALFLLNLSIVLYRFVGGNELPEVPRRGRDLFYNRPTLE